MNRSRVQRNVMSDLDFKEVFEFFRRSGPDTAGQAVPEGVSALLDQVERFLGGRMPQAERAAFFQAAKSNPDAVAHLAKEIQAQAGLKKTNSRRSAGST